MGGEIKQR